MIGFNLRINKKSLDNTIVTHIAYEDFRKSNLNADQSLSLFEDTCQNTINIENYTLYVIGTLIYKESWGSRALIEIVNDIRKNIDLNEIMKNSHGQFCLIIFDNWKTLVVTDKLGTFPVYIYEDFHFIQVSNIFLNLVRNNPVTLDYQAISEYCSFDYCFNATFFNEIKILDHGSIFSFTRSVQQDVYHNFLEKINFGRYTNLNEATKKAKKILIHNFHFLKKNSEKCLVDLTGGLDSRLNASILKSLDVKFDAGICGEQVVDEGKISHKVSKLLGVKLHSDIKIRGLDSFLRLADENFEISNGIPIYLHSTELINYYHSIKDNFDLHISGFAGSQLFDNWLPRLSIISNKLRASNLIKKSFQFKDIFKREIISERKYKANITKKIYASIDKLGTRLHDYAANYFTTTVYSKFYHGSLIGAHNTILPVYVPYLEADLVRLMIESSTTLKRNRLLERNLITQFNEQVSKVTTSHGFTSHVNAVNEKYSIQIVKDISRRIVYDFGSMHFLNSLFARKFQTPVKFAELQRDFWIDKIDNEWSQNMSVFAFIEKKKLSTILKRDAYGNKLKAKILYINKLIKETYI
jgi:hypothetical protein